jgi:hypothetical protein
LRKKGKKSGFSAIRILAKRQENIGVTEIFKEIMGHCSISNVKGISLGR